MSREPSSNVSRFVRSARTLLAFQMAAAAGAGAVTFWAVMEVQQLVEDRDRMAAQLAALEPAGQVPLAAEPGAGPAVEPGVVPDPSQPEPAKTAPEPDRPGEEPKAVTNTAISDSPPPPPPCRGLHNEAIVCVPPFRRNPAAPDLCIDGSNRTMRCPPGVPDYVPPPPPPPPPPEGRDCRNALGKAIRCAPPYRKGPTRGICFDARNHLVICPPGQPPREAEREWPADTSPNQRIN